MQIRFWSLWKAGTYLSLDESMCASKQRLKFHPQKPTKVHRQVYVFVIELCVCDIYRIEIGKNTRVSSIYTVSGALRSLLGEGEGEQNSLVKNPI